MQRATIGVGPALRKVREQRGLTLEEAARDTRVRREFLAALEDEEFDVLLGDVHVRGCLRTYATYLRLSPDKVVAAYAAGAGQPAIPTPPPGPGSPGPAFGAPRRRDNHRLVVLVAATVIVLAVAFGVLSARRSAPPPADLASGGPVATIAAEARPITVALTAVRDVRVTIAADGGEALPYELEAGEGRSFEADRSITVHLSIGGSANVIVNGKDEGFPGTPEAPWEQTYSYDDPASD